jgi:hypothetical protein
MKWGPIFLNSIVILVIIFIQWSTLKKLKKKEKIAFLFLTIFGWLLANTLVFFPEIPGPTQIADFIFKPLGKLLE